MNLTKIFCILCTSCSSSLSNDTDSTGKEDAPLPSPLVEEDAPLPSPFVEEEEEDEGEEVEPVIKREATDYDYGTILQPNSEVCGINCKKLKQVTKLF